MLGAHSKEQSKEIIDEQSESEKEITPFILSHCTFISGDKRYYLILIKPMDSIIGISINKEEKIVITVSHDNLKEIQQMAAKYIGSSTNIFETGFEKVH